MYADSRCVVCVVWVVVDVVDDDGTAHASLQELKAAGGGKAVDSVRIFKASVAILEEESAFMFHGAGGGGGRRADGTLLPDWNRDNNPNRDTNPNSTTLNSALNVKETRHILNMGLGITMQGQALQEEPSHKRRRGRAGGLSSSGASGATGATASSSTGGGGGKKSTKSSFKLHPSDYSAVKRKTGIARSDITALVVYSVPPAGVKLALEALRTLLHPYCDQHKKVAGASTPLPRAMDLEWSR
jgi:hypothetical protein